MGSRHTFPPVGPICVRVVGPNLAQGEISANSTTEFFAHSPQRSMSVMRPAWLFARPWLLPGTDDGHRHTRACRPPSGMHWGQSTTPPAPARRPSDAVLYGPARVPHPNVPGHARATRRQGSHGGNGPVPPRPARPTDGQTWCDGQVAPEPAPWRAGQAGCSARGACGASTSSNRSLIRLVRYSTCCPVGA